MTFQFTNIFGVLLASLLLVSVTGMAAEPDPPAFSILYIEAAAGVDISDNAIDLFWQGSRPWGIAVTTDFYIGEVSLGVQLQDFAGRETRYPDFENRYFFLRWGPRLPLHRHLAISGGGEIGVSMMEFEENSLYAAQGEITESEMTGALFLRVIGDFKYLQPWAGFTYQSILTSKRIEQSIVSGGLAINFNMPGWMSRILR